MATGIIEKTTESPVSETGSHGDVVLEHSSPEDRLQSSTQILAGAAIGATTGRLLAGAAGSNKATTTAMAVFGGLVGAAAAQYCRGVRASYRSGRTDFARLVGISERTIAEWERSGPSRDVDLRRYVELERLYNGLRRVVREESIKPWLHAPNPAFDDFKPVELIERGHSDRIWRMIHEMEANTAF